MPSCRMWSPTAPPSARAKRGQQNQQALHLLRAVQRHAIVPVVTAYSVAVRACERISSTGRPHISCGRCKAMPSCRMGSHTVLPPAHAKVPAALASITSLVADAVPCPCAGGGRLQCCHLRARKCQKHRQALHLSADAEPGHRAGCGRLQCCHQRGQQHRQALHILQPMQCHAILPGVATYSAATSACESAGSTGRPRISCGRC